jgi:hypothetical protein
MRREGAAAVPTGIVEALVVVREVGLKSSSVLETWPRMRPSRVKSITPG